MPYVISSWSVADGVSLSVSKSKLVYSSLIFVDNKLTLICLYHNNNISNSFVHITQIIVLIWRVLHL